MAKVLIWVSVVMFGIYLVKTQFLTSKTYDPFIAGCMTSGSASESQCRCLSGYMHKRYSDREIQAIMDGAVQDRIAREKIAKDVREGSLMCASAQ